MTDFIIRWENEDVGAVYLGNEWLFDVDYDTYGRAGQAGMLNAVQLIADRFSVDVYQIWLEFEEEDD